MEPTQFSQVVVTPADTHSVHNQPPELTDYNVALSDRPLIEATKRYGADWSLDDLERLGALAGTEEAQEWGRLANESAPVLRSHDRYGNRLDVVEYHPAYHNLMRTAVEFGLHGAPWNESRSGAHVARAAKVIAWYQVDGGHMCPISMTYSSVPALQHEPGVAKDWVPLATSNAYDHRNQPVSVKGGATFGMSMTEKQGGSDVRTNESVATPTSVDGEYMMTGHKWFCSAPMSDAFLMLAQAPGGLTCFLVPRWTPDGKRNGIRIQRLKDKLGDRSNASSEIEFRDIWAQRVGEEGRGVRTIIEMVSHTRLDCVLGSTAIMRQGVAQATWHTHHRTAFDRTLDQQPLMTNVLADLALESEAATAAALRLAATFDSSAGDEGDEHEQLLKRFLTPVMKYWTCKRAPQHAAEVLECMGGVGYVEETGVPRLFRQSPLNGVWEGSGNVICLDVLRAVGREPRVLDAFWEELDRARGADQRLDTAVDELQQSTQEALSDLGSLEFHARRLVEQFALIFQASLLVQHSPHAVADAFIESRLAQSGGNVFGTLSHGVDTAAIIERARPVTN